MIVLDVNVLLALFRQDHGDHVAATAWWNAELGRGAAVTVPDLVWVGFVRIATTRRIFPNPAPLQAALRFLDSVREQPSYARFVPHPQLLEVFVQRSLQARAAGDLVTDAYIASATISLGARLATFDRDFRRFDGLDVIELG